MVCPSPPLSTLNVPNNFTPSCHSSLVSCLSSLGESLPYVGQRYGFWDSQYSKAGAMPDVPGCESRVHTHDHDGFEAPDGSPDSILSSEPKPFRKHRPPPPPSILSPGDVHPYPP
ncbi:hypothetical protein Tco_0009000 [Tanacetum coccineum]